MLWSYGYASAGCQVTLIVPKTAVPDPIPTSQIFDAYGLPPSFRIRYLPTGLSDEANYILRFIILMIYHILWALIICFQTLSSRKSPVIIISYGTTLLLPYLFLKQLLRQWWPVCLVVWCHEIDEKKNSQLVYRQVNICLATNQAIIHDLGTRYQIPVEKCLMVANPIKINRGGVTDNDKIVLRTRLGLSSLKPVVVYTGKIYIHQAEIEYLLEAAAQLPTYQFVFTGGKPEVVKYFIEFCRQRDIHNTTFVGFLDHPEDVPAYQKMADVLVSYYSAKDHNVRHNFPNKILEYMASGNVVVTADYPAIRSICNEDNVMLVRPEDPHALVQGIREVIENRALRQRLQKAALETATEWTIEKVAKRAVEFIIPGYK